MAGTSSSKSSEFQGLRFKYFEMIRELQSMRQLAAPYLLSSSLRALEQCETQLKNIQYQTTDAIWQIDQRYPIKTNVSNGEYRASGKGRHAVYGCLCFNWEIRNFEKGKKVHTHFLLYGIASTSVKIFRADGDVLLAHWQFEVGDAQSPGCHFHASVNQEEPVELFPDWLKVPRFPGLMLTPCDALEFVLGELFQRSWLQHVSTSNPPRLNWSASHKRRLLSILKWQLAQVTATNTTPWMTLKKAKPPVGLLTDG